MTIPSFDNRREYAGDGTTNPWSFPIYFLANSDLVVIRRNADETETTLAYGTHYTISGAGNQAGGTVTPLQNTVVGATYVIFRDPPQTQTQTLQNGSALPAATIIRSFDKLTMIAQRLQEQIDRTIRVSETSSAQTSGEFLDTVQGLADEAAASATAAAASAAQADAAADAATVAAAIQYHSIGIYSVPVSPADATTAFQAAATASEGSDLFIPEGVTILINDVYLPNNIRLINNGTIKRIDGATGTSFISCSDATPHGIWITGGGTIDGNAGNVTDDQYANIVFSNFYDCHVEGQALNNSPGAGILMTDGIDRAQGTRSTCHVRGYGNADRFIFISKSTDIDMFDCWGTYNGDGIGVADFDTSPVAGTTAGCRIHRAQMHYNGGSGISMGHFRVGDSAQGAIYGWENTCATECEILDCVATNNTGYNFAFQARNSKFMRNTSRSGRNTGATGFLINASLSVCDDNVSDYDGFYALDAGGSKECSFNRWTVFNPEAVGINLGGTIDCECDGATIYSGDTIDGITLPGIEGDSISPFPWRGARTRVTNARMVLSNASAKGITTSRGYEDAFVEDCVVIGSVTAQNAYYFDSFVHQRNLRVLAYGAGTTDVTIASASTLVIPDGGDFFRITGTTSFSIVKSRARQAVYQALSDVAITAAGTGYTRASPPTIGFSGGGGSGAVATPEISNAGQIIGVNITNRGSGYTSTPTVTISGGTGSGATAVARIDISDAEGRDVTLRFGGTLTVSSGTGLTLASSLSAVSGTSLRLRGFGNSFDEVSRNGI